MAIGFFTSHTAMSSNNLVRPFLKWPGGKFRLLPTLLPKISKKAPLIEPFVGAGALFINANNPYFTINDINTDLIDLYRHLALHQHDFIEYCSSFFVPKFNNKKQYYQLRRQFNASTNPEERAALFLYLNRHGYNGLCRYNSKGIFNVPFGQYKKPLFPIESLNHFLTKIDSLNIQQGDYTKTIAQAPKGSIIYCDPPYTPLNQTASFTKYHHQSFDQESHEELVDCAINAQKRGCTVIISNHDLPQTRKLYAQAKRYTIAVQRTISCHKHKRGKVKELIAVYKGT